MGQWRPGILSRVLRFVAPQQAIQAKLLSDATLSTLTAAGASKVSYMICTRRLFAWFLSLPKLGRTVDVPVLGPGKASFTRLRGVWLLPFGGCVLRADVFAER